MNKRKQKILLSGMSTEIVTKYRPILLDARFEVIVENDTETVCRQLMDDGDFDAVVCFYPMETGTLGRILEAMRSKQSRSHGTSLVLIAEPKRLRAATSMIGRGVNKALSFSEAAVVLRIVLERLIEVAQPMSMRMPDEILIKASLEREDYSWKTDNLSGGGMLIETDDPPEVGMVFDFFLELDEGIIQGEAMVVRHTSRETETVDGFGARFMSFQGDSKARLFQHLRRTAKGDNPSLSDPEEQ